MTITDDIIQASILLNRYKMEVLEPEESEKIIDMSYSFWYGFLKHFPNNRVIKFRTKNLKEAQLLASKISGTSRRYYTDYNVRTRKEEADKGKFFVYIWREKK